MFSSAIVNKWFSLQSKQEKDAKETWKKKNGLIQRERPAGRESPRQVTVYEL